MTINRILDKYAEKKYSKLTNEPNLSVCMSKSYISVAYGDEDEDDDSYVMFYRNTGDIALVSYEDILEEFSELIPREEWDNDL